MYKLKTNTNPTLIVAKGIVFLLAFFQLFIPVFNHYNFRTFTFDYGVYNFAFYDYAHARLSDCPMSLVFNSHVNFLQDHFSLTLPILTPLFWIFQEKTGTYTLLILQWCFVIYGAWATFRLIVLKSQNIGFAYLALIYYFVMYGRYSSLQNDCNLAIIGAAMLPVFIYYFEAKKYVAAIVSFIFLVFNREDFSLCLVFVSLFLAYNHRIIKQERRIALFFSVFSLLSFIFIYQLVIPFIEGKDNNYKLFEYSILGDNPKEAIVFMLKHPIQTFKYLFINHTSEPFSDYMKTGFYLVYGISGGLLLLWRPIYLLLLLPFIAKKMFNDYNNRWGYEMYYSIEVATLLPLLVFSLISEVISIKRRMLVGTSILILAIGVTLYCLSIAKYPNLYEKFNVLKPSYYKIDSGTAEAHYITQQIPNDAAVSASSRVLPHLAYRKLIYHFPDIRDAEYVCLMKNGDTYPISQQKFDSTWKSLVVSGQWKINLSAINFILLQRKPK